MEIKDASFSPCNKHRIWLSRIWDDTKPLIMFIGLNPSTANAESDDPTIRRVKAMAKSWGYGGVYMMNLFTYISTDPKQLNIEDGNFILANRHLKHIATKCDEIIFAWGNFKVFGRDNEVKQMFPNAKALHINKNGSPKHPLYVKSDVIPINYTSNNQMAKLSINNIIKIGGSLKPHTIHDNKKTKKMIADVLKKQEEIRKNGKVDWNDPILRKPMDI